MDCQLECSLAVFLESRQRFPAVRGVGVLGRGERGISQGEGEDLPRRKRGGGNVVGTNRCVSSYELCLNTVFSFL